MPPIQVPVGIRAGQWVTVESERTVLLVAHNVTTVTRLLDVVGAFDSDFRVQVVVTWSGSDPFHRDLTGFFADLGIVTVPWNEAVTTRFDLAIAASHHGGLTELNAPLVILSHGIGYTKYSPGKQENRKTGGRQTFGLSPQWLLYDGQPIAEALVLSHPEQLARMEASVPEAVHTAVVAGDPCFDRMRASLRRRRHYRHLLGADEHRKVVVVSSTWSSHSVLGSWPDLLRQLLAELPIDDYRVVAIAHPNTWAGHGPWQLRTWLADCLRAGLVLVPPAEGWRAALIAADCVIGDNGATTCYGAALGRPTLLAAFPQDNVAVGSAVEVLGRLAPRLDRRRSLREQVESVISRHGPDTFAEVAELVTSVPDESPQLLRSLFYRVLNLPEPPDEPKLWPVPVTGLPTGTAAAPVSATLVSTELDIADRRATLVRYPAEVQAHNLVRQEITGSHLVCHVDHPGRALRATADILFAVEDELTGEPAQQWAAETLDRHPGCQLAAVIGSAHALVRTREGHTIELTGTDPTRFASVVYAWLSAGEPLRGLAGVVIVGGEAVHARLVDVD
ncbi:hypothetical protein ALI22I_17980 [Saccharothrix sp. ALI-22-I]|nr:hypothetical protein ALI22I_17980 [Saccharothrix sp. ALI-22-I]